jgi:hypothetical protein
VFAALTVLAALLIYNTTPLSLILDPIVGAPLRRHGVVVAFAFLLLSSAMARLNGQGAGASCQKHQLELPSLDPLYHPGETKKTA